MQGGHWCRWKRDVPSSICQTLLQSVNKNLNSHRTTKMQYQAKSLQLNIPQISALDTVITWKDEETKKVNKMNTLFTLFNSESMVNLSKLEEIGKFPGTYHIYLREDVKPVVHTPRKCPIAIQPLVDKKLNKLLAQEVIIPVTEPKDWVSSLVYSWKADMVRMMQNMTEDYTNS